MKKIKKDIVNKRLNKRQKTNNLVIKPKKRYLALFTMLFIIITCIIWYNIYNYKIYKQVTKFSNDEEVLLYTNNKCLLLWNKTINFLKENNKILTIHNDSYSVSLKTQNLNKVLLLNINTKISNSKFEEFKGLKTLNLNYNNFKLKNDITNLYVNVACFGDNIQNFDIYKIGENNLLEINSKCVIKSDNSLNINPTNDYSNYIIVYVPVQNVEVTDNININKNDTYAINAKILPENATNTTIKYKDVNEMITVDENNILTAKTSGNTKFKLYVENENIEKEINVDIIQTAEQIIIDKISVSLKLNTNTTVTATVKPDNAINKELIWTSSNENVATVDENGKITAKSIGTCTVQVKVKNQENIFADIKVSVSNVTSYNNSTEGITFIQGILVVNKKYSIPSTYNPGVDSTALSAFNKMKNEAAKEGISLWIASGFRSYETQKNLYNRYVSQYGQASADTFSARPGTSEHQTGLAFDINSVEDSFANTKEGIWLANNCYKYGFIIRYPKGKQGITGYKYEPWHIRYLGIENATKVYNSGLCLEEYLGI